VARNYEKLGQFCDAILPIETWVSLNVARNDTSQTRAIIQTYRNKSKCELATATGEEVFPISRPSTVVKLQVSINGTRGFFLLDTGATFVSLKHTFAQRRMCRSNPTPSCSCVPQTESPRENGGVLKASNCARFEPQTSRSSFKPMLRARTAKVSTVCSA
jgi:hypothetical protein